MHHFDIGSSIYTLDHTEPYPEELSELAPAKASTNPDLTHGKPWCIPPMIFDFYLNHYLYVKIDCALSL
jgi:hypothetical protein